MRIKQVLLANALLLVAVFSTGCADNFNPVLTGSPKPEIFQGLPFSGKAMGGQQPIGSSKLYMYAAGTSGYGAAAQSLIGPAPTAQYPSHADSNGNYYITTDATSGSFNFTKGQYQCSSGQQVYLLLVGGDVGYGQNAAISEIAILGTCGTTTSDPEGLFSQLTGNFVYMNEVSTVAAAYSLSGFATDITHIGSNSTTLALLGLKNAFNTAPNLYNINAGASQGALTNTPAGNGVVPTAEINSIADMLASCINLASTSSTNCSTLLSSATNASGVAPTDVTTAAINIAHSPAHNAATLATLYNQASPFQPILSSVPNDYSVIISFPIGSSTAPDGIAVDGTGNIWTANNGSGSVTELSNVGKVLSGTGYTNADMFLPTGIAIDQLGNAWVADEEDYLFEISTSGVVTTNSAVDLTGDPGGVAIDTNGLIWVTQNSTSAVQFSPSKAVTGTTAGEVFATSGGGMSSQQFPNCIAIDRSNNAFIANYKVSSASKFNSAGTAATNTPFGTALKQQLGTSIAIDGSGNFWMTNNRQSSVIVGSNDGSTVALASAATPAGVSTPSGIAFDGGGNAWIANSVGTFSVLQNQTTAVSGQGSGGAVGYSGATAGTMSGLTAVAIDGSGNVWASNKANNNVYEVVGGAVPVVTPIVAALSPPYTPASKP